MTPLSTAPAPAPESCSLTDLLAGTKYRAIALLGEGAQGVVVDAEHVALGKPVVVKVLRQRLAGNKVRVERMRVEAQALARLRSDHLVPVIDLGTLPDGRPYFVMEKVAGRTLHAEGCARGPFAPAEAIDVARQVLAALEVVHRAGLVHRDVKPANVFLCDRDAAGRRLVKLLDLGVAKVVSAGAVVSAPAPTAGNVAIGTPRFLSPEQASGDPVDGRADLYSVGVLLFWMLTGRDPFAHHEGMLEILMAHVTEPPPRVSDFAPFAIPPALEHAIHTALQKLPGQRYASAKDFADALAAVPLGEAAARAADKGTIRLAGGTVRMVDLPGRPHSPRSEPARPTAAPGAVLRRGKDRPLVSSLSAVLVIAATCAALTVLLLLGARLFGWLK